MLFLVLCSTVFSYIHMSLNCAECVCMLIQVFICVYSKQSVFLFLSYLYIYRKQKPATYHHLKGRNQSTTSAHNLAIIHLIGRKWSGKITTETSDLLTILHRSKTMTVTMSFVMTHTFYRNTIDLRFAELWFTGKWKLVVMNSVFC